MNDSKLGTHIDINADTKRLIRSPVLATVEQYMAAFFIHYPDRIQITELTFGKSRYSWEEEP